MAARIIDGRSIANRIRSALIRDIKAIKAKQKKALKLANLQIWASASSEIYLNSQMTLAESLGVEYCLKRLPKDISQKEAEGEIEKLNGDDSVTGIIVHTPVPKHIDSAKLFAKISPDKDTEGLNPVNIGRLIYDDWIVAPCTASACIALMDSTCIELRGKEAVIIGHSEIVGKPLALMLLSRMATTTVCHIGTYEKGLLKEHVGRAEVLVVSVGKSRLIKGDWIRKGAVVIDVGINRHKDKITGDVDFKQAVKKASYITPVPGGVGPVTAIMLMKNLVSLYKGAAE